VGADVIPAVGRGAVLQSTVGVQLPVSGLATDRVMPDDVVIVEAIGVCLQAVDGPAAIQGVGRDPIPAVGRGAVLQRAVGVQSPVHGLVAGAVVPDDVVDARGARNDLSGVGLNARHAPGSRHVPSTDPIPPVGRGAVLQRAVRVQLPVRGLAIDSAVPHEVVRVDAVGVSLDLRRIPSITSSLSGNIIPTVALGAVLQGAVGVQSPVHGLLIGRVPPQQVGSAGLIRVGLNVRHTPGSSQGLSGDPIPTVGLGAVLQCSVGIQLPPNACTSHSVLPDQLIVAELVTIRMASSQIPTAGQYLRADPIPSIGHCAIFQGAVGVQGPINSLAPIEPFKLVTLLRQALLGKKGYGHGHYSQDRDHFPRALPKSSFFPSHNYSFLKKINICSTAPIMTGLD